MTQSHFSQIGTFHLVTNARNRIPWCTMPDIPEIIMDNLMMSKRLYDLRLYAFCIVPNHIHIVVRALDKGISPFMHSLKRNISRDIRENFNIPAAEVREPPLRMKGLMHISDVRSHGNFSGWQKGFYDERIKNDDQLAAALRYVRNNAYGHRLVSKPEDWPWSSIHFPHLLDPIE